MLEKFKQPWVIAGPTGVLYAGLHHDEAEAWCIWLGWPSPEETEIAKQSGLYAAPATLSWKPPEVSK